MKRAWRPASLLAGLLATAMYAMPQGYTISARPGALNYIEGNVFLNGHAVSEKGLRSTFLNANDTLSTDLGKAEVLLTPGVFLRIGENSAVKMVSPSLTDTQVEVTRGEAMVEAAGLTKDNDVQVLVHDGVVRLEKDGLYRVVAGDRPTAAVIEGKAEVAFGGQKIELGKDRETALVTPLKAEKFDTKQPDDLYAWSNVRTQYDAAASYQSAKTVSLDNSGAWGGYGFGNWYTPGWAWNSGFGSWAWLPGSGAFYSPFGWGFYAPGVIGYAPVVAVPMYGGTYWKNHPNPTGTVTTAVAVNPKNPPAIANVRSLSSPAQYAAARSITARSYATSGFVTSNGSHVESGRAMFGSAAHVSGAAVAHASSGGGGVVSGGGGRASSSGFSGGGFAPSGHASGGGGGGGGGGHR